MNDGFLPTSRMHPDIFTGEEAAAYLRLPSPGTLEWCREHHGLEGYPVGKEFRYHRDDLDRCALSLFGKSRPKGNKP